MFDQSSMHLLRRLRLHGVVFHTENSYLIFDKSLLNPIIYTRAHPVELRLSFFLFFLSPSYAHSCRFTSSQSSENPNQNILFCTSLSIVLMNGFQMHSSPSTCCRSADSPSMFVLIMAGPEMVLIPTKLRKSTNEMYLAMIFCPKSNGRHPHRFRSVSHIFFQET